MPKKTQPFQTQMRCLRNMKILKDKFMKHLFYNKSKNNRKKTKQKSNSRIHNIL